jgi:putative ABC transport system substrate-binding protein
MPIHNANDDYEVVTTAGAKRVHDYHDYREHRLSRRVFLAVSAALPVSRIGRAQTRPDRPIVAVIRAAAWTPPNLRDYFVRGLRDLGLEEGQDYDTVYRSTDGEPSRQPALIAELVALNPAVIVAQTTGLVVDLRKATDTIPIIGTAISDPVEIHLASSLAHPGGNVTGFTSRTAQTSKQLEILLQIAPQTKMLGVLLNPSNAAHQKAAPRFMADVERLPLSFVWGEARAPGELETAFATLVREGADALYIAQDAMFNQEAKRIADLALAAGLPTTYGFRTLPDAGGLMSYGNNLPDRWLHSGWYAAKS